MLATTILILNNRVGTANAQMVNSDGLGNQLGCPPQNVNHEPSTSKLQVNLNNESSTQNDTDLIINAKVYTTETNQTTPLVTYNVNLTRDDNDGKNQTLFSKNFFSWYGPFNLLIDDDGNQGIVNKTIDATTGSYQTDSHGFAAIENSTLLLPGHSYYLSIEPVGAGSNSLLCANQPKPNVFLTWAIGNNNQVITTSEFLDLVSVLLPASILVTSLLLIYTYFHWS